MTVQAKPSVAFEMSFVNEHDPLLVNRKDIPLIIPCNTVFEESLLVMMKSSHDNVSDDIFIVLQ